MKKTSLFFAMILVTIITFGTGCKKDPIGTSNDFKIDLQWVEQTEPPFLMGCEGFTYFLHVDVESNGPVTVTLVTEYFKGGALIPGGPEPTFEKNTKTVTLNPGRNEYVLILNCVAGKPETVSTTDGARN